MLAINSTFFNIFLFKKQMRKYLEYFKKIKFLTKELCRRTQGRNISPAELITPEDIEKISILNKKYGIVSKFLYYTE